MIHIKGWLHRMLGSLMADGTEICNLSIPGNKIEVLKVCKDLECLDACKC